MGISGSGLSDKNVRLRFFIYTFMGIIALGAVMYWKSKLLLTTEYVDFAQAKHLQKNPSVLKSHNYQIETFDTSPSVK